ncbi:LysR family transcriptional regulator [Acetobacter oeni]|uniref:Transcriptional regulator n=1 Tax=Acetobacter oeni TaxID=304077 RepID=A0A511XIG1_9PROT|nr:LysR family transcriptional regulator [Acetobacter oeni]MBB3881453.1 DNA-binding transcriptional LysR family regulator [Acetobacter oeni]NHO18318.1 LysR family transcriptional regulator [Acetobacter oeni]GBR10943.1 LysR family transcriptional regulator [Acetobacter oeni LMG 21952]GEN62730.1 transcriptional regulator [Acetobacter oeni]
MRLPDFEAWAIFARVAEHGSFAKAADDVQLSRPTVSKAITRLETSLGLSLFNRSSRQLSLTEMGRQLLAHARQLIAEAEMAEAEARETMLIPTGQVRIAAPMTFGIHHLSPLLPGFFTRYPDVDVAIDFSDSLVDVIADGFDFAVRIATLADSSLRTRKLCDVRLLLVASPVWIDRTAPLRSPQDLESHKGFVYTGTSTPGLIRLACRTGETCTLTQRAGFRSNNAESFLPSLEAGFGYGFFPEFMIWEALRDGRLKRLLPEWHASHVGICLVSPPNALRPKRVQVLMDYLSETVPAAPWVRRETDEPTSL